MSMDSDTQDGSPSWKWLACTVVGILIIIMGGAYATLSYAVQELVYNNAIQDIALGQLQKDIGFIKEQLIDIKSMLRAQ